MVIAEIVGSNSHIDYIARVLDPSGSDSAASPEDHGFGRFVTVGSGASIFVGVIYDSRLINPAYANYGPKLQPRPAIEGPWNADADRAGVLIGIIILGSLRSNGTGDHSIPTSVVPVGQAVELLPVDRIENFHRDANGSVNLGYYQRLIAHSGQFAIPLLGSMIGQLSQICGDDDRERLKVLYDSLKWQSTFGGIRL
jgi:hypothetical protein